MTDSLDPIFVTVAMAEILLGQNLTSEARRVIDKLSKSHGDDPRVSALIARASAMLESREPVSTEPKGLDAVSIDAAGAAIKISWELTESGLEMARIKARYSGRSVLRLFSAVPGPRGVRTSMQDIEISKSSAELELVGLARPAVHVAAVGFLSNTGEFVPLAQSGAVEAGPCG